MASNPRVYDVFDEDDKLDMESDWPAHEWIGCGKKYQNIEATLPPLSLSPAGFFSDFRVPKFETEADGARDDTNIVFDAAEPSFIPANPLDLPLLPSATIQRLDADFGQAWFDGKKSIRKGPELPLTPSQTLKRRRTASRKLQCSSIVSEADISHLTPLQIDGWVFAADRVSYAVARTYEHSGGRSFRRIHQSAAILGLSTFAHLPSGAIIVWVPDGITLTERSAEVSKKTIAMFTELQREKAGLIRMVTALTTVQRKSGADINVLDLEEDDGVAD
ncbi:hypothetical protein GGX14DRAFT_393311 [Mycena pura]|uniref:Uncharacterized protein n=1 Tax=Mycena pura TaxID=153505 RepID=A0AAD6YEY2_9AGAR|nr:hypothetical protein GGX14DRAFT_393311 [Mycena pura]